jgi:cyclohexadienyl dehydratase
VRLIANPGSANEAFARANFRRATVIVHHDNASVFDELVAGRADVMITDGLEADHQARLHPELCAVPVAAPFTRLEKAYFFAPDPAMQQFIDAWLSDRIASGFWRRALDRAMSLEEP